VDRWLDGNTLLTDAGPLEDIRVPPATSQEGPEMTQPATDPRVIRVLLQYREAVAVTRRIATRASAS